MSLQIVSTEAVPLEQRKELWLHQVILGIAKVAGKRFGKLILDTEGMEGFRGEWQYADLDFLRFSRVKCTPFAVHIDPAGPQMQAIFPLSGVTHVRKGKAEFLLTPGTWLTYQGVDSLQVTARTPVESIVLLVDKHPLDLEGVEALHSFTAKQGVRKLIHEFVCDTFSALPIQEQAGNDIAEITVRLLRQAIAEANREEGAISGTGKQVSANDIKRFIEQHLDDALLSLEQIAAHFFCSKRTLHRAFAVDGESIERYIWHRRIDRCAQKLGAEKPLSLTDLAYRYGFNSSTHFSRLFKKHYNMTPTEFIRLQRQKEISANR